MSKRNWEAYGKSTYDWSPGHEKMLRMTKTSLTSDFDFCPKQYQYKRIHRLPEPETDAMRKGTNVHDAIEQYYDRITPHIDELHTLLQRDKWDEAMTLALSVLDEKEYTMGEQDIIDTRIVWDLQRLFAEGKDHYLPVINEEEVHVFTEEEFELNGETHVVPVHWAGSIDRGYLADDGGVALMELKTGKWVQTKKGDEWQDSTFKMRSMRTEMAFYRELLKKAEHRYQNVTHWGWVYPSGEVEGMDPLNKFGNEQRSVNRIVYEKCTGRRGTDYRKSVERLKNGLLTAYFTSEFPTKPSTGKCAYCSFKDICPAWEGSDDPEEYLKKYKEEQA